MTYPDIERYGAITVAKSLTYSEGKVLIVRLVRSQLSIFFSNVSSKILRDLIFGGYLKAVLPMDTFEAFLRGSISNKTAFCLGAKQGMLVNNEGSSWYNRVGNF